MNAASHPRLVTLALFMEVFVSRELRMLPMVTAAAEAHVHELQYKGLGELHDKYNGQGFEVLAFPCESMICTSGACTDSSTQAAGCKLITTA